MLPLAISLELFLVRITVDLNSQKQLWAEEIDDKFIDRFLPTEVVTAQLFVSQLVSNQD